MKKLVYTAAVRARLEREAEYRAKTTTYKVLARETGLPAGFINVTVGKMIQAIRCKNKVSPTELNTGAREHM